MKIRHTIFLIGLLVFISLGTRPGILPAQERKKIYTLEESVAEALAKNWTLKAKEEKIEQTIHAKNRAGAEFLPKLGMTYGYNRQSEEKFSWGVPVTSRDNYQWKGTLRQPIFTGFGLTSSFQLARLGIDLSEMDLRLGKLSLALRVKEAYFGILKADKDLEVAMKAVESLKSNVKVASSFYKVGMIPVNDLLKAEVELANAQQNLVKARNASRLARSVFNIVLSRPINVPVGVEDILIYKTEEVDFQAYLEKALENRPEIKLLDINILQTEQQIRLAKSKNYPEIALTYDYIKEGDSPDVSGSQFHDTGRWEVMASLSWTFWEWGKTYFSVKEQVNVRKELMHTKMALEDSISLELKEAVLALEEAEKNIPTTRKAVEQAEENLRVSEKRYKVQVTTITEVLDAQTLLTQARTNYYTALYDHNFAKAKLQRAMGEY